MEAGIGDTACSRSRSASRQATRQPPLLCLLLGGPGSGKTLLGNGLKTAFPMLCHASGGELARLATADEYRHTSPLLNSISRQMSDKRRRRLAAKRLVDVVTSVLAEGLQSHRSLTGLIADGVRATDIESFQQALGGRVVCVLRIDCTRETMLKRLEGRGSRDGDERLGLSDTTDDEGRVDAYLQRVTAEDDALQAHFGTLAYSTVFTSIDGTQTPEACLQAAQCALHRAAQAAGEPYSRALERIQEDGLDVCSKVSKELASVMKQWVSVQKDECTASLDVDWGAQMRATVARLDNEMHPDGRPRTHCEQSSMAHATDMRSNRDAALHGEKV